MGEKVYFVTCKNIDGEVIAKSECKSRKNAMTFINKILTEHKNINVDVILEQVWINDERETSNIYGNWGE